MYFAGLLVLLALQCGQAKVAIAGGLGFPLALELTQAMRYWLACRREFDIKGITHLSIAWDGTRLSKRQTLGGALCKPDNVFIWPPFQASLGS